MGQYLLEPDNIWLFPVDGFQNEGFPAGKVIDSVLAAVVPDIVGCQFHGNTSLILIDTVTISVKIGNVNLNCNLTIRPQCDILIQDEQYQEEQ